MSLNDLLGKRRGELGLPGPPVDHKVTLTVVPDEARDAGFMGRCASWAEKALHGRASTLAAMNIGDGRNDYLNKSAYVLLRFAAAGHLDAQEVYDTLGEADGGITYPATKNTLDSAARAAERDGPVDPPVDSDAAPRDFFADLDVLRRGAEDGPEAPADGTAEASATDTAPSSPSPLEPTETPEEREARMHAFAVKKELALLRAREDAKRLFTAERAALEFREPPSVLTLREQLLLPRDPVAFSIAELLPRGGNALLTAQFKAGKTTVNTSLLRSVADGEPFLGRYDVQQHDGRIAIFNYELSQQQYDQWLEDAGIVNSDRVSVLHLRGFRLDIRVPRVEDWIVQWLRERDVKTWIADPFARAAVGVDENSNTEVGVWLDTFDVIKERAGVIDGVLTTHTGRAEQESGQERARGATRLDDWADVRWILTKDDNGTRFFRATGRDVEVPEEKLTCDDTTRRLTIGGGDRAWERRRHLEQIVVAYVKAHPGSSGAAVEAGVEGKGTAVRAALKGAVAGHLLRVEDGPKGASLHYANG